MLKRRLIPVLFLKNGLIVRSQQFSYHQNLGNATSEVKRYSDWNVDELIYIDISKEKIYDLRRDDTCFKTRDNLIDIIHDVSKVSFMPLTFGGGIRTLDDIRMRLQHGADKVTINSIVFENESFVYESAKRFGAQCIIVSIDVKYIDGIPYVFKGGHEQTTLDPVEWAREVEKRGAGEIFLNSIDRDGMAEGYDCELIGRVTEAVNIPVIACGGAADTYDFIELAKKTEVSAIAAGNMFHFTELSYPRAKNQLEKNNINVRIVA